MRVGGASMLDCRSAYSCSSRARFVSLGADAASVDTWSCTSRYSAATSTGVGSAAARWWCAPVVGVSGLIWCRCDVKDDMSGRRVYGRSASRL